MNLAYNITERNSVQILSIKSLLDEWQNRQILQELQPKIEAGATTFVVDLAQLRLVNSIGLNFLLTLFSRVRRQGGEVILANVSKGVYRILEMTKLSNIFPLESSVENAVDALGMELMA
ncbi:MAG: STAS domain-containing protein [Bacteroidota bacterium]